MVALLTRFSAAVDDGLHRNFYKLGKGVAFHPWRTIGLCFLVVGLSALGFLNFTVEDDSEDLYTPSDAGSFADRERVEAIFGRDDRLNLCYLEALQPSTNTLTQTGLLQLLELAETIENHTATFDGELLTYEGLCAKAGDECERRSVLDLFNYDEATIRGLSQQDILDAVNQDELLDVNGLTMDKNEILGGQVLDQDGNVAEAKVLALIFQLEDNAFVRSGRLDDFKAKEWELTLHDEFNQITFPEARPLLFTQGGAVEIEDSAITSDVGLIPLGYILMFIYAILVLGRRNITRSQGMLALMSVCVIMVSTFGAFGFTSAFIDFSLVVQASIFLLLGIGIDDTFVIVNALRLTDPSLDIEERVAQALSNAGAAITVTSVTDVVAFAVGTYSSIPAIQVFCLYTGMGILYDFVFQCTMFIAILTLDLRRQKAKRMDFIPCIVVEDDSKDCISKEPFDEKSRGQVSQFISHTLIKIVLHPVGKVVVLAIAATLLGVGMSGALKLEGEFDYEDFIPEDGNFIDEFIQVRDANFGEASRVFSHGIFTFEGDYFEAQDELAILSAGLPNLPNVFPDSSIDWFGSFQTFLQENHADELPLGRDDFFLRLGEFLDGEGGVFKDEFVLMNEDRTAVEAARMEVFAGANSSPEVIETMDAARALAAQAPTFDTVAFQYVYLFMDGLKVLEEELIRNLILAGLAVFIVCSVLLANFTLSALVTFLVFAIDVEILGYAYFMGESYNPVTVINALVAVGIAVDYNVHIAHGFLTATGTRQERAAKALDVMGGPVISGAFSTFLAIVFLSAAVSYVFQIFFLLLSAMILFSLFQGVFVLPVILSLVGPASHREEGQDQGAPNSPQHGNTKAEMKTKQAAEGSSDDVEVAQL